MIQTIQTKNKVRCYKNFIQVYRLLILGYPVLYQVTEHFVIALPLFFSLQLSYYSKTEAHKQHPAQGGLRINNKMHADHFHGVKAYSGCRLTPNHGRCWLYMNVWYALQVRTSLRQRKGPILTGEKSVHIIHCCIFFGVGLFIKMPVGLVSQRLRMERHVTRLQDK
jgi:hypothetical protein